MKYGDALKAVFEAFYKDRSDVTTTYTTPSLRDAVKTLPPRWKAQIMADFKVIAREIEQNILSCPHPTDAISRPYDTCEECAKCGCKRFLETREELQGSMFGDRAWSDWKVW